MIASAWLSLLVSLLLSQSVQALVKGENNYACKSIAHPNPVVLIHGLFCNADYMDAIASYLQARDFCTYATTYGANPSNPNIGGLKPINASAVVLADFITSVKAKTGAAKVDLVGHSEGALMTLYVSKLQTAVTPIIDKIVSIAPPTHGTTISGIANLIKSLGPQAAAEANALIHSLGCQACTEVLPGGPAITALNNGPVAQSGIQYHIVASKKDEVITPVWTAFVNETGVSNFYIQDKCPHDITGHLAEPFDSNIIQQVAYYLDPSILPSATCGVGGAPLKS